MMSYRRHSSDSGFSGSAEVAVVEQKVQALAAAWARVLLVEDEVDIRELIRYSLAQAGLDVAEASDGAEALDKLRAFAPDLVVLELILPGMPGLEVCQRLRSRAETARLPIMVVSAKSNASDKALGIGYGRRRLCYQAFQPARFVDARDRLAAAAIDHLSIRQDALTSPS